MSWRCPPIPQNRETQRRGTPRLFKIRFRNYVCISYLCIFYAVIDLFDSFAKSWKDYRAVTADLKRIYKSATEQEARTALDDFAECWDGQYPQIARSWYNHWDNLITLFNYPPAIRKVIYTTNAIESLNSVIRKATKRRKLFPSDDSALKVAFLAIQQASKKWTMPIRDWKPALNRFIIEFGDRLDGHL